MADKEVAYDVEEVDDAEVIITATNDDGIMKNSIFLWPRSIFSVSPEVSVKTLYKVRS